jgi:hypothetical protein
MATGGEIVLDEKFISLLAQADKNIKAITGSTESAEKSMVKWLSKLNSMGLDSFTKHLENIRDKYLSMSTALEKNNAFKTLASNCLNAADATQKLIDNLSKANGTNVNNSFKQTANSVKDLNTALASPAKSAGGFSSIEQEMKKTMDRIILLKNEITTFKQLEGNNKNILNTSDYANIGKVSDELTRLMSKYKTLDGTLKGLKSQDVFKTHMDNLNGTSLAAQKQKSELNKLNEAYRNGTSELQKKAKIEDAAAQKELANTKIREQAQKRLADSKTLADRALNYTKGMYSPQGVLSVNNMQKAIQQMQTAQRKLNLNTEEGRKKYDELQKNIDKVKKDLDKATDSSKKFGQQSQKSSSIFSQLKTQLTAVFGIAAIKGYLQQLVNIRKEFELQKVALGAILQSKEQANQLWNQTVQLALKSPFSVKELITYTKQLSAYRIETDKLHDTTKRLADVSAGLGVDMSRLILAYGQVRAAEYLRGTELRQFTEAGIPMLEELAKYFSDLEGSAISTADVFEMISKRMVEFKDVEAVINRMTNEGGVFFQMQEKQSKTLHGELSNLQDAYHLMLNDIGETQSGTIKNLIRITRSLVDNWETIANVAVPALNSLIFGMITFRIVSAKANGTLSKFFTNLTTNLKAAKIYLTQGSAALQSFMPTGATSVKASVWGVIIGAIVASVMQLINVWIEHNKALEEVNKKYNELRSNISRLHVNFINATKDLNLDEQRKALQDLIDMANDEYYMKIKIDVKEIDKSEIEATFNNIREQIIITNAFANKFATSYEESNHWKVTNSIQEDFQQLSSSYSNLANEIKTKKNTILSSFNDLEKQGGTLSQRMKDALEIINTPISEDETELEYTQRLIDAYKTLIGEREDFLTVLRKRKMQDSPLWGGKATDEFNKWKNWYENAGLGTDLWDDLFGDLDSKLKESRAEFDDFISTLANDIKHFSKEDAEVYLTASIDRLASENEWSEFVTTVVKSWTEKTFVDLGVRLIRRDKETKKELLDWQKTYNRLFETFHGFKKIEDPLTTQIKTAERLKSLYDSLSEEIGRIKKAGGDATTMGKGAYSNKNLQQMIIEQRELKEQLDWFGFGVNETTNNKSQKDYYSDVLKILQDTHKEYKDLTKTLSHADAKQLALDKHTRAFAEAIKNIPSLAKFKLEDFAFDKEDGAIEMLEKLKSLIPKTAKNYNSLLVDIEQAIGDIRGEKLVEEIKAQDKALLDSIEEMFSGYEISLELDKLGIPKEYIEDIFGIKTFDLSYIRKKIEKEIDEITASDTEEQAKKDLLAGLKERLKKVEEFEDKSLEERLKKYVTYLKKSQSETLKIRLEEAKQLAEIDSLVKKDGTPIDEKKKAQMREGVKKETQKKLDKATWEEFTGSDMYIQMFEDLDKASSSSIRKMIKRIEDMKDSLKDLDPQSLKAMVDALEKLKDEDAERNPFRTVIKNAKEYVEYLGKIRRLREDIKNAEVKEATSKNYEKQMEDIYIQAVKDYDKISKDPTASKEQIQAAKESMEYAEEVYISYHKASQEATEIADKARETNRNLREGALSFAEDLKGSGEEIQKYTDAISELVGVFDGDAGQMISEIGGGLSSMAIGAGNLTAGFATGDPLAMIQGVTGIASGFKKIVGAFDEMHDKKKEREIQRLIGKVEELGRAYEKLQKQIENAYSLDQFRAGYAQSKENIEQQIQATEDMIAAEQAKKDTDDERIREWQNNIEDYKEQLKELEDQRLQELGGFGESGIKSAADDFVDAWLTAYQETGDGLDALEGKWDEYIRNIIKKQMALRVADKVIAPITEEVDKALEDSALTDDELAEIDKMTEEKSKEFNQMMHQLANYFGSATDALKENVELSGLTQGIQGVTEQTADQLAGLVNSIRLYSANNNATLLRIADAMEQNNPQTENPMVAQLRQLVMHTESIYDLLNNLTIDGGKSIHVKM